MGFADARAATQAGQYDSRFYFEWLLANYRQLIVRQALVVSSSSLLVFVQSSY